MNIMIKPRTDAVTTTIRRRESRGKIGRSTRSRSGSWTCPRKYTPVSLQWVRYRMSKSESQRYSRCCGATET
jgi:hypothetical protein